MGHTDVRGALGTNVCDNCHVTPNNWKNPALAERKCSMSCQTCHVDPAGGGMRNTSGRFFGNSTLPMIATSPRPTDDWDRNPPLLGRRDRATTYNDNLAEGPVSYDDAPAYRDSIADAWAWGRPLGGTSRYGFWDGRYGALNADPRAARGARRPHGHAAGRHRADVPHADRLSGGGASGSPPHCLRQHGRARPPQRILGHLRRRLPFLLPRSVCHAARSPDDGIRQSGAVRPVIRAPSRRSHLAHPPHLRTRRRVAGVARDRRRGRRGTPTTRSFRRRGFA